MAVSGADVEKIKDEIDPRFNELSLAIENLKLAAKEKETKEKARRRHEVIMRSAENFNTGMNLGRSTNGWNYWCDSGVYNGLKLLTADLNFPTFNSGLVNFYNMPMDKINGSYYYFSQDFNKIVILSKKSDSSVNKIMYKISSNADIQHPNELVIEDFIGEPTKLYANKEIDFFAVCVNNKKIRLYNYQPATMDFVFSAEIDFDDGAVTSMEGGGDMIFITTTTKKVFGIRRNSLGSYNKLTHSELGIDIEGNIVFSKCTPDGETVVFVNEAGYSKGKEFVRIYKKNGSVYEKQPLDLTNRRYDDSHISFGVQKDKARRRLQISDNGETVLLNDSGSYTYTTVIKKDNGSYRVCKTDFNTHRKLSNYFSDNNKQCNYILSDCGRYLFIATLEGELNNYGIKLYYYEMIEGKLTLSPNRLGFVPLLIGSTHDTGSIGRRILEMKIIQGNLLTFLLGRDDGSYRETMRTRIFIEIPWEV